MSAFDIRTNKSLAINSILILISTSVINTFLHELAHFTVASYFGLQPELHHNYVITFVSGTEQQQMLRAAAGPLLSLLLGIVATYISVKCIRPSLSKLFFLWMGMGSLLMFMGYMLIAPIAKKGDTGKVFDYFGVPVYISIFIAIIFMGLISYLFSRFSRQFIYYKNDRVFKQKENKKQLFLYPIFSVIIVMTLMSFPIMTPVSLLPVIFMPMAYLATMGAYGKLSLQDAPIHVDRVSVPLIIMTIFSLALFRYLV